MDYTARDYRDETDYRLMRQLLIDSWASAGPLTYASPGDLDWWRALDEDDRTLRQARLWFDAAGALAGFVWPGDKQVDILVHPAQRAADDLMLEWIEARRRNAARESATDESVAVRVWSFADDTPRLAALRRRAYTQTPEHFFFRYRELTTALAVAPLPPGYTVRHFAGESEIEERVNAHRDAFDPSRMTVAKHRKAMAAPTYRQDLDLVAVTPDGEIAAYCIVWYDEINRIGEFEPVGCRAAHQRRGLARAVISEGLRRLDALGARAATVWSWWEDEGPNQLYESLGFLPLGRVDAWEKQV